MGLSSQKHSKSTWLLDQRNLQEFPSLPKPLLSPIQPLSLQSNIEGFFPVPLTKIPKTDYMEYPGSDKLQGN